MIYEQFLLIYFITEINEVNISEDLRRTYLESETDWGTNFGLFDSF